MSSSYQPTFVDALIFNLVLWYVLCRAVDTIVG